MKKRIRDKQANKQKIVDETKKLIIRKGYSNVTIREIAKNAKVSVGLIYKDFPNGKPEIVRFIFQEQLEQLIKLDYIKNFPLNETPDVLRTIIKKLITLHKRDTALNAALHTAYLENREIYDTFEQFRDEWFTYIPMALNRLNQAKLIKIDNYEKVGIMIAHTIDAVIHRHVLFTPLTDNDEDLVDFLTDLILKKLEFEQKLI